MVSSSGLGVPEMMTGGRPIKKHMKAQELRQSYEDIEAQEIPAKISKKGKN